MYRLRTIGKIKSKKASEISSSRLGIGFEKLDRAAFHPERAYDKLERIGVKWVRIQSGWQRTETKKGVYDFGWLDEIVDQLIARGMTPWMCLCYGNGLYGGPAQEVFGAVGCPPIQTQEQRDAWLRYCVATAAHFRGRVDHLEIWNEPDGKGTWKYDRGAKSYTEFAIATAQALRQGNPDCYIIGGSMIRVNLPFLSECFRLGLADCIDAVSFHAYHFDDRKIRGNIRALRGLIRMYNPSLEIIQGESGAQSRPFGHGAMYYGGWTPRKQAKYLLRHMIADLGLGVKFSSYFSCLDMAEAHNGRVGDPQSHSDFAYFGVLGATLDETGVATGEYAPKPSYYALSTLASLLHGNVEAIDLPIMVEDDLAKHCGNIPSLSFGDVESYAFALDDGSLALAYWHHTDLMTTDFESAVTLRCAALGDVRLVDPMDGTVYELPPEILQRDAADNITLSLLPIRDYPLLLLFEGTQASQNKRHGI